MWRGVDDKQEVGGIPPDGVTFDVIVVGGGPGGSGAAGYLSRIGLQVLLIEKMDFPRDKICGDAVGGKSISHIEMLGAGKIINEISEYSVTSILFSSPAGHEVDVPLGDDEHGMIAGYCIPRLKLDKALFDAASEHVSKNQGCVVKGGTVTGIQFSGDETQDNLSHGGGDSRKAVGVEVKFSSGEKRIWKAELIVGAAGHSCPVARTLITETYGVDTFVERDHYCGGWREYWDGVEGCEGEKGKIEIHFVDEVNPGYFWIFPVGKGRVNVGMGMLMSELDRKNQKLKKMQSQIIKSHPIFSSRFRDASIVRGSGKGWLLPFGSPRKKNKKYQPRRIFGNGVALVGDAACLVDPFSGEGIGNALFSAKILADIIEESNFSKNGWGVALGEQYQAEVWKKLGPELTNSYRLQRMLRRKWLVNRFVKRASKRAGLRRAMTEMIASKEEQTKMRSIAFLLRAVI